MIFALYIGRLSNVKQREAAKAYLFIMPAIALALCFSVIPFLKTFVSSFLTISQSGKAIGFAGLDNYKTLFEDKAFISSIGNTLRFTLYFLPLNTVMTFLAAALTRRRRKCTWIMEAIFITPLAFSLSAFTLVFKEIFRGEVSIINRILHTSLLWLDRPGSAMAVLVILGLFLDFAIDYILLTAAFRSIDRSVIEAAEIDGAGEVHKLFAIETPMIATMLSITVFMALKDAILISAPVMILTEGGPFRSTETIMYFYYLEAFKSGNRAYESVISSMMVITSAIIMGIIAVLRRKDA